LWVSVAVALAFADASVVVLALPQIVARLHTSISHVTWVIMAYNLALIAGSLAILAMSRRLTAKPVLITGLLVFAVASLACSQAQSVGVLVALRVAQGVGGALLLGASLPQFAAATRAGESPLAGWAVAAAIGAAIGPAAGGVLTDVFDWRAIFLAQTPVAALAALAVWAAHPPILQPSAESNDLDAVADRAAPSGGSASLDARIANLALALISAGLIGALFLVTVLLINVWGLSPLGAAAILSVIPLATALTARLTRGRSPVAFGALGALTLAVGLTMLALISHRELGLVALALALCGTGLGLAFPTLTEAALRSGGSTVARAARTIAARDAGLLLGLLILTPIFVNQLNGTSNRAIPPITRAVLGAQIPLAAKVELGAGLLAANAHAPPSQLPDIGPAFAHVADQASPAERGQLALLKVGVGSLIQRAATRSFRPPLLYCALFELLVIPLLGLRGVGGFGKPR
jgi:predicted MFS family arabinose efflux permease